MIGIVRSLVSSMSSLWPDGGQGTARRNAWAAMVSDNITARARDAAEAAVVEAQRIAEHAASIEMAAIAP